MDLSSKRIWPGSKATRDKVQRINDSIVAQFEQRAGIYRELNAMRPAVNIPAEILAIIFDFACWGRSIDPNLFASTVDLELLELPNSDFSSYGRVPPKTTPVSIGSVCSAWRNVTLSAPRLWSNIEIRAETRSNSHVEKIAHHLSRSGQHPLTVEFDPHSTSMISTSAHGRLIEEAHRIQTLSLTPASEWDAFINSIANKACQLMRLELREPGSAPRIDNVKFFAKSPKLREVLLDGFYRMANVSLPWAQLERLDMEGTDIGEFFEPLQLCPCLRTFAFYLTYRGLSSYTPTPMTLPSLEVLEVKTKFEAPLELFLEPLTLPSLRSFSYAVDFGGSSISTLLDLINRSACNLETLCLAGLMSPNDIAECLSASPRLRELQLYGMQWHAALEKPVFTKRLLDLMNPKKYMDQQQQELGPAEGTDDIDSQKSIVHRGTEAVLAPGLEKLFLHGKADFDAAYLVEFIADRWNDPVADFRDPAHVSGPADKVPSSSTAVAVRRLKSITFWSTKLTLGEKENSIWKKVSLEGMHVDLQNRPLAELCTLGELTWAFDSDSDSELEF